MFIFLAEYKNDEISNVGDIQFRISLLKIIQSIKHSTNGNGHKSVKTNVAELEVSKMMSFWSGKLVQLTVSTDLLPRGFFSSS